MILGGPWLRGPWRGPQDAARRFYVLFLGFVSPWIGLIAPQAVQIAFTLSALSAVGIVALEWQSRTVGYRSLLTPAVVTTAAFAGYVLLESMRYHERDLPSADHLVRPVLILMLAVQTYVAWTQRDSLDAAGLPQAFVAGVKVALGILVAILAYQYALAWALVPESAARYAKNVREINRFLEGLAVMLFLVPVARRWRGEREFLALLAVYYVLAFQVIGYWSASARVSPVDSETVQIGIPLALGAYTLARLRPKLATRLVFGGIAAVIALAPWLYKHLIGASDWILFKRHLILDRLEIWHGSARRVLEEGLAGFAFGHGREFLRHDGNFVIDGLYTKIMPFHPHNMVLQLWVDMGAIGAAFLLAFLYKLYAVVDRTEVGQRPGLLAGLTMLFVAAIVTHSLWQLWFLSLIFCALLLMLALAHPGRADTRPIGSRAVTETEQKSG